jgi:hypothetical protein
VITEIYDQSGHGNNLTQAPGGGAARGPDNLASATAAPVTLNGHKAYGVYVAPGTGYRDDNTTDIATGDSPEGEYDIVDGTHYNGGCCFDYGNAETNNDDDGNGTMEAIYFGNIRVWGYGTGNGPWIMADLENGLYSGVNAGYNANDPTIDYHYTTDTGSTAISGWALAFTFPGDQHITNAWNGTVTQSGQNVTITNASYNGTIAPGGSTSLGFQGTWTTSDAAPTAFTLNGTTCTS